MSSDLYKQTNYTANIPFMISNIIKEYDISKANINILYKYGILNEKQYNYFLTCPRMERQTKIGLMEQKNRKISEIKKKGIEEARRMLFETNDIIDSDILAIKNDAIFLINKTPAITKFENIEFVHRNTYSSFYKLNNGKLECYYLYDSVTDKETLHVKGINDYNMDLHKDFFVEFLLSVFQSAEMISIDDALQLISSFNQLYVSLDLECGFYRNFDETSKFLISARDKQYLLDTIGDSDKKYINNMCNMNIIRELWSYLGSVKFKYHKM